MPFAVCWCQRASGVFCSLSYTDASFFILVYSFVVSFWPFFFFFTFLSRLCFLGADPHLNCDIPPPPSCNINHSNIRCTFTWIWSTEMCLWSCCFTNRKCKCNRGFVKKQCVCVCVNVSDQKRVALRNMLLLSRVTHVGNWCRLTDALPWFALHPYRVRFVTREPSFSRGDCGLNVSGPWAMSRAVSANSFWQITKK